MSELRPTRVEYAGPEGTRVWADEDGVHAKFPNGFSLEMPDMRRLIALFEKVSVAWESDKSLQPRPPSKAEIAEAGYFEARDYGLRAAERAVKELSNE